jgi:hypothetical protein
VIVVSDTSVVTALIRIGKIDLLFGIFGAVIIPEAVARELSVTHVDLPAWITATAVKDSQLVGKFLMELDAGESEAIALALELKADYLLMDEKLGRAAARRVGLTAMGILGVATAAKRLGLLDAVAPVIKDLRELASFWISEELENKVHKEVGEG